MTNFTNHNIWTTNQPSTELLTKIFVDSVTVSNSNSVKDIFDLPFNNSDTDVSLIDEHVTKINSEDVITSTINSFPLLPFTVLFWYLICVHGTGVIFNSLVILDLFRKKQSNGFYTLILQLAISDIMLLTLVSVPELWSHNGGSWVFGSELCVIYLGFEVFSGTANVYFIIAICFHTVTTINVLLKHKNKDSEEQLLDDGNEIKTSRHSLVSRNNDSLQLNKATDMGLRNKTKIPVIIPVILVWILAASLSVPEFALSTTIVTRNGPNICTFIDGQKFNNMRILLSIFQLIIPVFILVIIIITMVFHMHRHVKNLVSDVTEMLKLSICLQILYFLFNTPRSILSFIHVLSYGNKTSDKIGDSEILDIFKAPPLNNSCVQAVVLLILSFMHFMASILRPLLYAYYMRSKKYGILSKSTGYTEEISEENKL